MSDPSDPTEPRPFSRRTLGILARGPFGRYAVGESISMTGTWMQGMAQSWVVTGLTTGLKHQALMIGTVNFAGSIPMLLLAMYGGALADRYDKRKILIATQVVQIALAAGIGWLIMTRQVGIWHIITAATLLGISSAFEMPSASALVPELVAREDIGSAVAVDRAIFHGTRLIGPALAGAIIGVWGSASAFFINALSFIALIAAVASIHPRARGSEQEEAQRQSGMKEGIEFVRRDRPTLAMLGVMAVNSLCIFPFIMVMLQLYARDGLKLDEFHTGWLTSVTGIGSLVASVGLLSVPRPRRVTWMIVATVDIFLSLLGFAVARTFWQAAIPLATLGLGTSLNYGLANTTVQERAPGPLRGRVSALAMMSFVGVLPFAALGVTALADYFGLRTMMVVCALGYVWATLAILLGPARRCTELPTQRDADVPVPAASQRS